MHKTGTSALQAALAGFDNGQIAYARFDQTNHSLPIYAGFASDPLSYRTLQARGLSAEEILARRDQGRARLASELKRNNRSGLIIIGEDIGKIDHDGQRELVRFITERGWNLRVFCYLRPPESFAASALQQRIKSGLAELPASFNPNYRGRVEVFRQELGEQNLCLRVYDRKQLQDGDVIADFCSQVGIAPPQRAPDGHDNQSLTLEALRLIFALNGSNSCGVGDAAIADARNALIAEVGALYPRGEKLDPALFAARVDLDDVAYLAENFDIAFDISSAPKAQSLEAVLLNLDAVDPAPLARRLGASPAQREDRIWMINRLFAHHIGMADLRRAPLLQIVSLLLRAARDRVHRRLGRVSKL
jgi:hypothetical protein